MHAHELMNDDTPIEFRKILLLCHRPIYAS